MQDNLTRRAALGTVGAAGLAALAATVLTPSQAAAANYPKLRDALDALSDARDELKKTDFDFKGHKGEALDAIAEAVKQVQRCIDVL